MAASLTAKILKFPVLPTIASQPRAVGAFTRKFVDSDCRMLAMYAFGGHSPAMDSVLRSSIDTFRVYADTFDCDWARNRLTCFTELLSYSYDNLDLATHRARNERLCFLLDHELSDAERKLLDNQTQSELDAIVALCNSTAPVPGHVGLGYVTAAMSLRDKLFEPSPMSYSVASYFTKILADSTLFTTLHEFDDLSAPVPPGYIA